MEDILGSEISGFSFCIEGPTPAEAGGSPGQGADELHPFSGLIRPPGELHSKLHHGGNV